MTIEDLRILQTVFGYGADNTVSSSSDDMKTAHAICVVMRNAIKDVITDIENAPTKFVMGEETDGGL